IAVIAGPLLIVAAVEIAAPAPFLRAEHQRVAVHGLDHGGVVENFIPNLLHGGSNGVNVLLSRKPNGVFVIHQIIAHAAVGGDAPTIGQVLDVPSLKSGIDRHIGVVRVVPRDVGAVAGNAVARIGKVGRIVSGLRPVFGDGITGELVSVDAVAAYLGRPADHGNGNHRQSRTRLARLHEAIRRRTGGRGRIADAFEVKVGG